MREYYVGANTAAAYFLGRTMSSFPNSLMFLLAVRERYTALCVGESERAGGMEETPPCLPACLSRAVCVP